jgi:hypothetical protein
MRSCAVLEYKRLKNYGMLVDTLLIMISVLVVNNAYRWYKQ